MRKETGMKADCATEPQLMCGQYPTVVLDPEAERVSLSFRFTGPIYSVYRYYLYDRDGTTEIDKGQGSHTTAGELHHLAGGAAEQNGRILEVTIHYWADEPDKGAPYSLELEIHQKKGDSTVVSVLKKSGEIEPGRHLCSDFVALGAV